MNQIDYTPQRITAVAENQPDQWIKVSVFAQVASNGLAYYRWLNEQGKHGQYYIVHVASGLNVIPNGLRLHNPKQCQKLIANLDPVTNWRQSAEMVRKTALFVPLRNAWRQAGYELW